MVHCLRHCIVAIATSTVKRAELEQVRSTGPTMRLRPNLPPIPGLKQLSLAAGIEDRRIDDVLVLGLLEKDDLRLADVGENSVRRDERGVDTGRGTGDTDERWACQRAISASSVHHIPRAPPCEGRTSIEKHGFRSVSVVVPRMAKYRSLCSRLLCSQSTPLLGHRREARRLSSRHEEELRRARRVKSSRRREPVSSKKTRGAALPNSGPSSSSVFQAQAA